MSTRAGLELATNILQYQAHLLYIMLLKNVGHYKPFWYRYIYYQLQLIRITIMDFSCKLIVYEELFECDRRLKMAECQIEQLHTRRAEVFQRYLAAYNNRDRNFRAVCRGRLLIVEGVLTAYKMYIQQKKRQVVDLRRQLYRSDRMDIGETVADDSDLSADDSDLSADENDSSDSESDIDTDD